ncbi:MAG: hypothetical protein OXF72_00350 [Gammaproteobacteria bacterium]|nr:hypothetical protein [Gammaproteobacteria bacterium]MCY4278446.1 hypothetical protein [Gammaproteobacteria bacterium]
MPNDARLKFQIEGLASESGDVRLDCFLQGLQNFDKAVRRSTALVLGDHGQSAISFRIVDLSHDSPACVTLEGFGAEGTDESVVQSVLGHLMNSLTQVCAGSLDGIDAGLIEAFKDLAAGVGQKFSFATIRQNYSEVRVDSNFATAIATVETQETESWGSVRGHVERFNSHGKYRNFYLYSKLGETVRCDFSKEMLGLAVAAVEKSVTVTGRLHYRIGHVSPYKCQVHDIDIHEADSELPELEVGVYPHMTGDSTAADYLKEIRDGWD